MLQNGNSYTVLITHILKFSQRNHKTNWVCFCHFTALRNDFPLRYTFLINMLSTPIICYYMMYTHCSTITADNVNGF